MKTPSAFISHCGDSLAVKGAETRKGSVSPGVDLSPDIFARRSGRSLGIFFPYDDYFFFHDFSQRDTDSRQELEGLHEKARAYVNTLYRFPRWMRYRVPNICTVAVSGRSFGIDLERYAHSLRPPAVGGERHSVFLVDLVNRRLISTGMEVTSVDMVAIAFKEVNPHNRAHGLIVGLCSEYFGGNLKS